VIERRGPHAQAHIRSSLQLRNGQVIAHGELAQVAVSGNREAFREIGTVIFRAIDYAY